MGIFKGFIGLFREIHRTSKRYKEYKTMSKDDLLSLDNEELCDAVAYLLDLEGSKTNKYQRTVLTIDALYREVNNGGLCQFFVNSSSKYAPYVSESLEELKFFKIKNLFDQFILKNHINLNDLSSFKDNDDFEELNERYPFDDFDDEFYCIEEDYIEVLSEYIRHNIKFML